MNTNDLYLEYARVIQMCKGTELEGTPWVCVKLNGENNFFKNHPDFTHAYMEWEFAVAVLEGRPVWVGDAVYLVLSNHTKSIISSYKDMSVFIDGAYFPSRELGKYFSLNPPKPKRTFTLNGVDLPCPIPNTVKRAKPRVVINNVSFFFDLFGDAKKVRDEIINLLTEARDK